jgi:tetratricopeptide (TPR) repeat protein
MGKAIQMKRISLVFIMLFLSAAIANAQTGKEEAIANFVQGNLSYKEGDFLRAIEKYEGIIAQGKASGPLYYNLANAYYRQGDLGKAILNYERAKRLLPRDGDLNFNYKYVLAKADLYEGEIGRHALERAVKAHIDFYSIDEMITCILLLTFVLCAMHLGHLYLRWPKAAVRAVMSLALFFWAIFAGGLFIKAGLQEGRAVVVRSGEAKFEPRDGSTTHYKVQAGESVKVLKEDGSWAKIERSDGKLGWLDKERLEKI